MRIQGNSHHSAYLLVSTAVPSAVAHDDAPAVRQNSRAPLAAYTARQDAVDVVRGVSSHAQRAIKAYMQNDVFEQRTHYAQLLGIDIYA